MFTLPTFTRRLVYVGLFETLAILFSTILLNLLNHSDSANTVWVAVAISAIAVIWNLIYNSGFEWAERALRLQGRSVVTRIVHSVGFEGGLVGLTVPLLMVWYSISFWSALQLEAAILVFFLVFTFVFTWVFDQIFTLPNAVAK